MDADVVADFRPQAFAARTAAENFKNGGLAPVGPIENSRPAGRNATAAAESVAAPLRCAQIGGGPCGPPNPRGRSPSSRLLASDPAALATPLHTLFQQPAKSGTAGARPPDRTSRRGSSRPS